MYDGYYVSTRDYFLRLFQNHPHIWPLIKLKQIYLLKKTKMPPTCL